MMVAVMAVRMPAPAVIPVHGVGQVGSNAGRAAVLLPQVQWQVLAPFCAGSVAGAAVGGLTVVELDPAILNIGLAFFILYSVWAPPLGARLTAEQQVLVVLGDVPGVHHAQAAADRRGGGQGGDRKSTRLNSSH